MTATVIGLVPLARVADVQRSIDFYQLLGLNPRGTLRSEAGKLIWAHVQCEQAALMFSANAESVISGGHSVLFYLYSSDLIALREKLLGSGIKASSITYPN